MTDIAMCNYKVRPAVLADATEIALCLSALGYGTLTSLITEQLASFVKSPVDAVFVASIPGHTSLLGAISVHLLPLFHAPGLLGRITSLAVSGEARGKGVGQALVAAAEEWAWSEGAAHGSNKRRPPSRSACVLPSNRVFARRAPLHQAC